MFLEVIKMILPIAIFFSAGIFARKIQLFSEQGSSDIKAIICNIFLPVVIFNAFMSADYSISSLIVIITTAISITAVFLIGNVFKKIAGDRQEYFPFMVTSIEGGMMGYPLIMMLFAMEGLRKIVLLDVGHNIFLFLICIPLLLAKGGKDASPKGIIKIALSTPTFIAMMIGIICGIIGIDNLIETSKFGEIYNSIIDYANGPIGALIILTLGYDLSIDKKMLNPVLKTVFFRLIFMAIFCVFEIFVVSRFMNIDKVLLFAIIVLFSLPASFSIPLFARTEKHKDYISTCISIETIICLILFIFISFAATV